jgi:thiol-disulfide isomerase/thioredoxin
VADGAVQLGPLLLPFTLLLVMGALGVTLLVGNGLARRAGVDVEPALWRAVLLGVVAARLAFVYEYRTLYFASPLSILDIRDGGWNAGVGLVAGWLFALYRQRRAPALARPLRWAMLAGTLIFVAGTAVLALRGPAGEKLPALSFAALDGGEPVPLSRFAGRPVVVNLWATWCPPCVREMPVLQQAQAARPDVHFVFLNQGESPQAVANYLRKSGLALRNVLLDGRVEVGAALGHRSLPTTLFFDAQGRLVETRVGELSEASLAERLSSVVK